MEASSVQRPSNSALLSISCGIKGKFVLQVFRKELCGSKLRMFLSDGCALMCAEIENKPAFKVLKENSLLRVEVKYSGMEVPLQILSMEIVQADYQYVFGNPIPFIDFLNKQPNHKNWQESQNGTPRHSSQDSQSKVRRNPPMMLIESPTNQKMLRVEDIDRYLDGSNSRHDEFKQSEDQYSRITELYPKMRCWKLLARVTWMEHKMCNVSKGVKSGQKVPVINFFIVDDSGEIKCSMFDEAATKFKDVLKRHGVYEFSSGTLIEEVQREGGFQQKENQLRRGLSIRFECYSKIVDKTGSAESNRLPLVTYRLAGFDELRDYELNTELDIAGIVKTILLRENHISDKHRISFVLVDPFLRKELEVAIFLDEADANRIEVGKPVVVKNVKTTSKDSTNNLLYLRGGYNTQLITEFPANDEHMQRMQSFSNKQVLKDNFESMSQIRFVRRSITELQQIMLIGETEQSICSRIQCYFTGVSDDRKFIYQACYKCNKKINLVNKLASHCPKCNKIVDVKDQYLLQCCFADHTDSIKISLMGDHAKKLVKMEPQDFAAMTMKEQCAKIRALEWTELCLLVRSTRNTEGFNHSIYGVEPVTIDSNLQRIRRFVQEQVKLEDA